MNLRHHILNIHSGALLALPQEGTTAQDQRDHFARQLSLLLKIPPVTFSDWSDAFAYLSIYTKSGDIILFDEISWMGTKNSSFIPKLKAWWDKQTTPITLVICGSVSTWIENNILKSTALFGRINLRMTLEPLSIPESAGLLKKRNFKASHYDVYKILSMLGGIPWYLEQIRPSLTADENIKQLAFEKNGLLVFEFDRIFNDLFDLKGASYKKILEALKDGGVLLTNKLIVTGPLAWLWIKLVAQGVALSVPEEMDALIRFAQSTGGLDE